MGRVTFQDSEVIRRINRDFCATWRNVHPGYRVEHLQGARFEEVKQIPNGQASENVVTLFCTAGGELLHVVPGHWKPKDYAKEIDFALSVAQAVARAGTGSDSRREAVRQKHRIRLAALDRSWDGGDLGRLVMENAHRRMIEEPLRSVSQVRGVEDYALNPANTQPAQAAPPEAIRRKMQRASELAERWKREGKDLSPVARVMNAVEPLLRQGRFQEAETVLDRGLQLLGDTTKSDAGETEPPTREARAPASASPAGPGGTPEALEAAIAALVPGKLLWREIAWKSCLLEGLREARERKKPVILWVFGGEPTAGRC